jgi:signal transduction histidine kinase/CheY-like chemotaxis protein
MNRKPIMYIIDKNHKILYVNDEFKKLYSDFEYGQPCYRVLGKVDKVCDVCPIFQEDNENIFYNDIAKEWVKACVSELDWNGVDGCYAVITKTWHTDRAEEIPEFIKRDKAIKFVADNEQKKHHEERLSHIALIKALSRDYSNVFYVDLLDNTFEIYRCGGTIPENIRRVIMENDDFEYCACKYIEDSVYQPDRESVNSFLNISKIVETLKEKPAFSINYRIARGEGQLYQQIKCVRVGDSESFTRAIVAFKDVDEEVRRDMEQKERLAKALRQAELANRAKTTFLFNMSHDIRTPMNAVIGFTEIARKYIDDKARVVDSLEKVEHASKHLLHIINDILDMAKIESGKIDLEFEPYSIRQIIKETEDLFRVDMESKGLDFEVIFENVDDVCVFCDVIRLKQIEINLLSNAFKYTPVGGKIVYRIVQTDIKDDNVCYELHFTDNGIGMSEQFQKNAFGVFERERTSTDSGVEGTGLGLAITKRLVDMYGGTIDVHSKVDVGTEFVVKLCFRLAKGESLPPTQKSERRDVSFCGRRVLIAEDNVLNREIAEVILSEYGFEVETAEDGEKAVDMVVKAQPGYYDLVLMDIQMPKMDGYAATVAIRAINNPVKAATPVVAMTANAFDEDKKKALSIGMDGYVAKPIDVPKLIDTLLMLGIGTEKQI